MRRQTGKGGLPASHSTCFSRQRAACSVPHEASERRRRTAVLRPGTLNLEQIRRGSSAGDQNGGRAPQNMSLIGRYVDSFGGGLKPETPGSQAPKPNFPGARAPPALQRRQMGHSSHVRAAQPRRFCARWRRPPRRGSLCKREGKGRAGRSQSLGAGEREMTQSHERG